MHNLPYYHVSQPLFPPAGLRIGKGEGFADMEYGMMASMGAVDESTVVVTVVHDCQVSSLMYVSGPCFFMEMGYLLSFLSSIVDITFQIII